MRVLGAVLAAVVAATSGCTSVKLVQRDGCWVKRTEKFPKRVYEEVGPCARERPAWSDDRLVRLVQECVAASDHRWQTRALAAWTRQEPLPERPGNDSVLRACLTQSAQAVVTDNETLRQRLAEVSEDRDALRKRGAADQRHLLASHDKLAAFLGEAATKTTPPASATAYAVSDGKARTETTGPPASAAAPIAVFPPLPAAACPAPATAPAAHPTPAAALAGPKVAAAKGASQRSAREPSRRARPPPRVQDREVAPTPAAACPVCPPAPQRSVTDGNGTAPPMVAPVNGEDLTSH